MASLFLPVQLHKLHLLHIQYMANIFIKRFLFELAFSVLLLLMVEETKETKPQGYYLNKLNGHLVAGDTGKIGFKTKSQKQCAISFLSVLTHEKWTLN